MNLRSLFFAAPLALAFVAAAQAAESSLHALFACQAISADAARLACLDREVAALRGESKPAAPVAAAREPLKEPSKEPLKDERKYRAPERVDSLAVAGVSKTPHGKLVVKLQNGQVWTQTDSIQIFTPRDTPSRQTTASIRDAALGSYKMQLDGDGPWFRVSREK